MVSQRFVPYQKPSQKPITTAHLAQTMTLLGLNNLELLEKIVGEISSNPALDLLDERRCPTCNRKLAENQLCPNCSYNQNIDLGEPIVFVSSRQDFYTPSQFSSDDFADDEFSLQKEDLPSFVLQQIAAELPKEDRAIAAHVLTALDEDGFLTIPFLEIARYHHVPESRVEDITKMIQRCDPIGVGSRTPQEALLVQLAVMGETQKIDPIMEQAVLEGLDLLSKRQYGALGKKLGISAQHAKKVAEFIAENLNPFPARAHWGTVRNQTDSETNRYHTPDVIVHAQGEKNDLQLVVEILWPIRGSLQINPEFRKAIQDAPAEKAEEWNQALEKASLLIKCLSQRNHTLVQLMQKITFRQKDFILRGDAFLKPTTRAQLADEIGVHESTISRAVANKSVQLPSGQIIPISKFFDRSLHIRTELKKIIAQETKPLSDTKITHLLAEKGYNIARRTVAKYRAMEGILPAHLRGEILNS